MAEEVFDTRMKETAVDPGLLQPKPRDAEADEDQELYDVAA